VADAFPPAEARPARTPEEMRRLAWRVLIAAFGAWLVLAGAAVYGLRLWVDAATVPAPATLQVEQGIVLFQDRGAGPLLNARNGMRLQEGDALEIKDNSLARLDLPGRGTLRLGPNAHVVLADLRAGRFNAAAGRVSVQHTAGTVRAEVEAAAPGPLALETPYGTVRMGAGDFVVAVPGPRADVYVRAGSATVSIYNDSFPLAAGERTRLAPDAAAEGPLPGAANLVRNGDFAAGLDGWRARDAQEDNRPDRLGERLVVAETVDGLPRPALRVARASRFDTHNETGVEQDLHVDVSVYPRLRLTALVKVQAASLSGGGYLGTEYPMMLRLRYRDVAGNGQTWYRGFYYQNTEGRPTSRGEVVPQGAWTRVQVDLAELPERPAFVYSLEILGAGHDFDALITDVQLVAE
jgi:hypothetical protein